MSYAAAVEPLRVANQLAGKKLYRWWNAAPADKPAIASNGAAVLPDFKFGAEVGALDVMLVCAGGNPATFNDRRTFTWLRNSQFAASRSAAFPAARSFSRKRAY